MDRISLFFYEIVIFCFFAAVVVGLLIQWIYKMVIKLLQFIVFDEKNFCGWLCGLKSVNLLFVRCYKVICHN